MKLVKHSLLRRLLLIKSNLASGFTLIELMTVLAVVAILVLIAYPSYLDQVRKSRRAVAKSALLEIANREEQYFFSSRAYTSDLTILGYSANPTYFGKESVETAAPNAIYKMTAATTACGTSPCFKLTADTQNDQTNDSACTSFSLTSSNQKLPDPASSNCW